MREKLLNSRSRGAAMAALLAVMLLPGAASAHGTVENWVYNDAYSGGRRAHGGNGFSVQHYKVVVTVRLKTCNPSNCSGTVATVKSNTKTCVPPQWNAASAAYLCDALTAVYSGNPNYRCWGSLDVTVYHPNTSTVHYTKHWEPEWGFGPCTS